MLPEMKPIIEVFQTNLKTQLDDNILKAVFDVGVHVDKERLIKALEDAGSFWEEGYLAGLNRSHGTWIGLEYDGYADGCPVYDLWECSNCGEEVYGEDVPITHPFCHGCGAKMDGD